MMRITDLSVKTRHLVLDQVSYAFYPGRMYGIVAVNGSGKTTLFRAMMKLIPLKSGEVMIGKKTIEKRRRKVFYFETFEWFDGNLSGMDYLRFVRDTWHSDVDIEEVIEEWKMDDYVELPIRKYSLGMKQRLIIAMYLVSDARYLIFDEITNGLDEYNRTKLFSQLKRLCEQKKMILISSQYKNEMDEFCDVILSIKNRSLVEETV